MRTFVPGAAAAGWIPVVVEKMEDGSEIELWRGPIEIDQAMNSAMKLAEEWATEYVTKLKEQKNGNS